MENQETYSSPDIPAKPKILLTGATGYIGGRLLKKLEAANYPLRCFSRHPQNLKERVQTSTEIFEGDIFNKDSVEKALENIDTAYYLIHSMGDAKNFVEKDRKAANIFADAASKQHVKRIIYLGGLGNEERDLSDHLESRQEVGRIFRERAKNVQVVEFRASIVIGAGSLSFEMIRSLSERLPVMITPKWVWTPSQPISIFDLLAYLFEAATKKLAGNPIFEIGGKDQVSYADIMKEYSRQRGLKRTMIPVPVLTPYLSSLWLGIVTPLYARIGRKIVESARFPTIVQDPKAEEIFDIKPMGMSEAIEKALKTDEKEFAETWWMDAISSGGTDQNWAGAVFRNRLIDSKTIKIPCPPEQVFEVIQKIGGHSGWYYGDWLWRIRGFIDSLMGGVGLRRGRRDPVNLRIGDSLDFWRVEKYLPGKKLRLHAEMKLPGRAWLEFEVKEENGEAVLNQTALFDPIGIGGLVYWYSLFPIHHLVFKGMLNGIANEALKKSKQNTV